MLETLLELGEVVDDDNDLGQDVLRVLHIVIGQRGVLGQPILSFVDEVAQHADHLLDARRLRSVDGGPQVRQGLHGLQAASAEVEGIDVQLVR